MAVAAGATLLLPLSLLAPSTTAFAAAEVGHDSASKPPGTVQYLLVRFRWMLLHIAAMDSQSCCYKALSHGKEERGDWRQCRHKVLGNGERLLGWQNVEWRHICGSKLQRLWNKYKGVRQCE